MAAVHFSIIPCEADAGIRHKGSHSFEIFVPVPTTLCMPLGLKILKLSSMFF